MKSTPRHRRTDDEQTKKKKWGKNGIRKMLLLLPNQISLTIPGSSGHSKKKDAPNELYVVVCLSFATTHFTRRYNAQNIREYFIVVCRSARQCRRCFVNGRCRPVAIQQTPSISSQNPVNRRRRPIAKRKVYYLHWTKPKLLNVNNFWRH